MVFGVKLLSDCSVDEELLLVRFQDAGITSAGALRAVSIAILD